MIADFLGSSLTPAHNFFTAGGHDLSDLTVGRNEPHTAHTE